MKIPFDSECLAAVAEELRAFVGGKVQGVRQPNDTDVLIALYNGGEAWLLISASAEFGRRISQRAGPRDRPRHQRSARRSGPGLKGNGWSRLKSRMANAF